MRNLLALLAAGLLAFCIVGYFRGWYTISKRPAQDGHQQFQIDVNGTKIKQDLKKSSEKIHDVLSSDNKSNPSQPSSSPIQPNGNNPGVQPAGFIVQDGSIVFPASSSGFTPPGNGTRLPPGE